MNSTNESKAKYPRYLSSRCSEDEYQRVSHAAQAAGLSNCAYVRLRATGAHVAAKTDAQTVKELRRVGGLLKKLWTASEAGTATANEITATLNELRVVMGRI